MKFRPPRRVCADKGNTDRKDCDRLCAGLQAGCAICHIFFEGSVQEGKTGASGEAVHGGLPFCGTSSFPIRRDTPESRCLRCFRGCLCNRFVPASPKKTVSKEDVRRSAEGNEDGDPAGTFETSSVGRSILHRCAAGNRVLREDGAGKGTPAAVRANQNHGAVLPIEY